MYKGSKHGGFGCIQYVQCGREQRIASAVRLLNSNSLATEVLQLAIALVAGRARYQDGLDAAAVDGQGPWLPLDNLLSRVKDDPFTNPRPLTEFRRWRGAHTFMIPSMCAVRILEDVKSVGVWLRFRPRGRRVDGLLR